jgi:hypothetical protein
MTSQDRSDVFVAMLYTMHDYYCALAGGGESTGPHSLQTKDEINKLLQSLLPTVTLGYAQIHLF